MRNVPPETVVAESLDAILADLAAVLAALKRPAELVEAEDRLIEAREARAEAWEIYRDAGRKFVGLSVNRDAASDARVLGAKAAVDKAEVVVAKAQKELNRCRLAHGADLAVAVRRHREAAAVAISGASEILAAAMSAAEREHVELPDVVFYTPEMQGVINAAHRAASRQRASTDRAFSKAAAALSARSHKPPALAPTKWRMPRAPGDGGVVADVPRPIKPGSSMTTQRITMPADAPGGYGIAAAVGHFRKWRLSGDDRS